jgi:hypothetical protein
VLPAYVVTAERDQSAEATVPAVPAAVHPLDVEVRVLETVDVEVLVLERRGAQDEAILSASYSLSLSFKHERAL